jgi:hypothetical protein
VCERQFDVVKAVLHRKLGEQPANMLAFSIGGVTQEPAGGGVAAERCARIESPAAPWPLPALPKAAL